MPKSCDMGTEVAPQPQDRRGRLKNFVVVTTVLLGLTLPILALLVLAAKAIKNSRNSEEFDQPAQTSSAVPTRSNIAK